jgi:L-asparaginase II
MCASHSGEPVHIDIVQSMLNRVGCTERDLQYGCHVPISCSSPDQGPCSGSFLQLHHNCSGKHAGFLAYCRQHGLDLHSYLDPAHPLQQAVRKAAAHCSGLPADSLRMGTDGCSAPNYAMPLSRLALACVRFAHAVPDPHYGIAPQALFDAMAACPELVSGTGRTDLAISRAGQGDWVAKAGAEGVQAVGVRSLGLGMAITILDGNARPLAAITIAVLEQLGLLRLSEHASLAELAQPALLNCNHRVVGRISPAFVVQSCSERLL